MNNEQPRPGLTVHCQEIVELVTDYLEGALDPEMTAEVEVRTLRRMRHHVEQMRTTVRALGRVPVESLTGRCPSRTRRAFRDLHGPAASEQAALSLKRRRPDQAASPAGLRLRTNLVIASSAVGTWPNTSR
jgi:anti-sigma factor RsiW